MRNTVMLTTNNSNAVPIINPLAHSLPEVARRPTSTDTPTPSSNNTPPLSSDIRLELCGTTDRRKADRAGSSVRQHVQRIGQQASRLADPAGDGTTAIAVLKPSAIYNMRRSAALRASAWQPQSLMVW